MLLIESSVVIASELTNPTDPVRIYKAQRGEGNYNMTNEHYSKVSLTIGITDEDGKEHKSRSEFNAPAQLFSQDVSAEEHKDALIDFLTHLTPRCLSNITRMADTTQEEIDAFNNSEEGKKLKAKSDEWKETMRQQIHKRDDELLRKSKQLSRLTTERFARIEDTIADIRKVINEAIEEMKIISKNNDCQRQRIKELMIKSDIIIDGIKSDQ